MTWLLFSTEQRTVRKWQWLATVVFLEQFNSPQGTDAHLLAQAKVFSHTMSVSSEYQLSVDFREIKTRREVHHTSTKACKYKLPLVLRNRRVLLNGHFTVGLVASVDMFLPSPALPSLECFMLPYAVRSIISQCDHKYWQQMAKYGDSLEQIFFCGVWVF